MKKLIIFLFIISTYLYGANDKATVVGFVGTAELKSGKKWLKIKIDDKISTNSIIRIKSKEDYLELLLPDNSTLRILGGVEDKIANIIKKQPKPAKSEEKFAVVERTGAAAVRGGIGKPGSKPQNIVRKVIVKGFVGECKMIYNENLTNLSYGMEIDFTNKLILQNTNSFLRLEIDGNITNIYGPFETTLEEYFKPKE